MDDPDHSSAREPAADRAAARAGEAPAGGAAEPWRAARKRAYAAQAILVSPRCHSRSAVGHLLAAWEALAELHRDEAAEPVDLVEWIRADGAGLPPAERETAAELVSELRRLAEQEPWQAERELPERSLLLAHSRLLQRALDRADRERLGGADRRQRQRRWLVRGAIAVVVLAAIVVYLRLAHAPGTGQWRAEYYRTDDLSGSSIVRRDQDVRFDWGLGRPLDEIRPQRFSVRWDTCLGTAQPTSASFELTTQGGGRVYVDGELIVDNWESLAPVQRGEVSLDRGVHHVRVEYHKHGEQASVLLTVSFGNRRRQAIPTGILRYPEGENEDDPCGTER